MLTIILKHCRLHLNLQVIMRVLSRQLQYRENVFARIVTEYRAAWMFAKRQMKAVRLKAGPPMPKKLKSRFYVTAKSLQGISDVYSDRI